MCCDVTRAEDVEASLTATIDTAMMARFTGDDEGRVGGRSPRNLSAAWAPRRNRRRRACGCARTPTADKPRERPRAVLAAAVLATVLTGCASGPGPVEQST